jgi:hypothetical protein
VAAKATLGPFSIDSDQLAKTLEIEADAALAVDGLGVRLRLPGRGRMDKAARPAETTVPTVPTAVSRSFR